MIEAQIQSLAEQRDVLLAEVSVATKTRDALNVENKALTKSNSEISVDTEKARTEKATIIGEYKALVAQFADKSKSIKEDISFLEDKKLKAQNELDSILASIKDASTTLVTLSTSVSSIEESTKLMNSNTAKNLADIKSSSDTVKDAVVELKETMNSFNSDLTSKIEENIARHAAQDKREDYLNGREKAIDELHAEFIAKANSEI